MAVCDAQRGLTLIETLVALVIMAVAASSILVLIGQNTRFLAASQERAYASIAADNVMVETLASTARIEVGVEQGKIIIDNRELRFRRTIIASTVAGLFRVDIEILNADTEQVIASATTLRRAPP